MIAECLGSFEVHRMAGARHDAHRRRPHARRHRARHLAVFRIVLAGDATLLYYLTEEAKEGRNAFLEKRAPDFSKFPRFP